MNNDSKQETPMVSRRSFLKGAAAGAVGIAITGAVGSIGLGKLAQASEVMTYTPGTYTATAKGMEEVKVTMTFAEHSITDVVLDLSGETESIGQAIGDSLKRSILDGQSADIDVVSGATITSKAVKEAAANCIAQAQGLTVMPETEEEASWRTPMEPVNDIAETIEADVLVIGSGHAGIACARELAEQGVSVILIENQSEDVYRAMGNAAGCINSEYLRKKGVEEVDFVDFYTNWQLNTNNGAVPKMAMDYAKHSGEYVDWFITELCTAEEMASTSTQYFPLNEERRENMLKQIGHHKFWSSSIDLYGMNVLDMTQVHQRNHGKITGNGGQVVFATKAQYLVQDSEGNVTGAVAKCDGRYIQYNAKVVTLATGGFGGNQEMMKDLLPDLVEAMQGDDQLSKMGMDRDGSGIAMGYWAGAAMEHVIATMDGRTPWIGGAPGLSLSVGHPQGMWMDERGKRFMNEYWGPIEFRARPLMRMNRDRFYCVYDSNLPENLTYVAPNHGTKDPTHAFLSKVQDAMDAAVQVGSAGYQVDDPSMFWYGAETLEELVSFIDADAGVQKNILDSIAHYNELCEAGRDEDFGREPSVMFPIKDGPFFMQVTDHDSSVGNLMCTMGGLITSGDQQVLRLSDWRPIPGLFSTGNSTGGRFGEDYFTPLFGASIGMCITLGRECGKSIVKYLNDEL